MRFGSDDFPDFKWVVFFVVPFIGYIGVTLPETSSKENRAFAKRNGLSSKNIHFQGFFAFAVAFREGKSCSKGGFRNCCP